MRAKSILVVLFFVFLSCDAEIAKVASLKLAPPTQSSKSIITEKLGSYYNFADAEPKSNNSLSEFFGLQNLLSADTTTQSSTTSSGTKAETAKVPCEGAACASTLSESKTPKGYIAMVGGFYILILAILVAAYQGVKGFKLLDGFKEEMGFSSGGDSKGALGWIQSRDPKFKMNVVRLIIVLFMLIAKWLQDSNGTDSLTTDMLFTYTLPYLFTFLGDLAVTGNLTFSSFNLQFLLKFVMFVVYAVIDVAIIFGLVLFFVDIFTKFSISTSPTLKGVYGGITAILIQQLYGNALRDGWVYTDSHFTGGTTNIIKSVLVIVLAIGSIVHYFLLHREYSVSVTRQNCVIAWDKNVGRDICEVYNDESIRETMLMCTTFCTKYADEKLCKQLKSVQESSTCTKATFNRNLAKDIATGVVLVVLTYLVLGGLIKGNKFSLAGLFSSSEPKTHSLEHHSHKSKSHKH